MPGVASTCAALGAVLDETVAGIMLTNPNTLGLFEEDIASIAAAVHEVGGWLLYYDGANLNAILGVARPGDMGFDIVHMNLHKTFATPHGGGGDRALGRSRLSERLAPFLPGPRPVRRAGGQEDQGGRVRVGDAGGVPSAGCTRGTATQWSWPGRTPTSWPTGATACGGVADAAVLNANWLRQRLRGSYEVPYDRPQHARAGDLGGQPEAAQRASRRSTWPSGSWRRGSTPRRCTSRSPWTRPS